MLIQDVMFCAEKNKEGQGCPALQWSVRYKIAVGIAEAIEYLHNGTERCVIHRDIKPSNIVLSSKIKPKVRENPISWIAFWFDSTFVPFINFIFNFLLVFNFLDYFCSCAILVWQHGLLRVQYHSFVKRLKALLGMTSRTFKYYFIGSI